MGEQQRSELWHTPKLFLEGKLDTSGITKSAKEIYDSNTFQKSGGKVIFFMLLQVMHMAIAEL